MTLPKVFLCAGDESGWAIDEDRRLTLAALDGVATLVDRPEAADVIHACWWEPLMRLPAEAVRGKPVICHMQGDPARVLGEPPFQAALARVTQWIAQSRGAFEKLSILAGCVSHVPYAVDVEAFARVPQSEHPLVARARAAIPADHYAIANFHRDTAGASFGPGMDVPKLVKGPDVFLEILSELHLRGERVVALLAGPRRHWLRKRLRERSVPVVFVGEEITGEDYPRNILAREVIAGLYHLANLHLCTSRSEGGPRGILEAAAAGCPQLSTPVGLAPDVLHADCLFTDAVQAVERIQEDIRRGTLKALAPAAAAVVQANHTIATSNDRWSAIYACTSHPLPEGGGTGVGYGPTDRAQELKYTGHSNAPPIQSAAAFATSHAHGPIPPLRGKPTRISFWNKFTPAPWGGGNQFMTALMNEAKRQGFDTTTNGEGPPADGHILNSVQFDIDRFRATVEPGSARVVHRIDGPISILRGTPESLDQDRLCFGLNLRYATATVIQSWHTVQFLSSMGFTPVRPALILNACDPTIFSAGATRQRQPGDRLRIIASAWSPNPGKGAAIYQWLDEHLDPERYEFTFVGNTPAMFRTAKSLPPVDSHNLAAMLREHDVYLTASRNDPCSNALIEALACGLPAIYLDSGGHPELTGFGGLPFTRPDEIPALLERIANHYALYRSLIRVESMSFVCKRYVALLFNTVA